MEIFEVLYRGKKIIAMKTDKGDIYAGLPTRYGERGNKFQESITKESNSWKFASSLIGNPEYGFNLWLREDGRLAYGTHSTDKILVTKDAFNPDLKNGGKLNNIATEVYYTVEQLKAYEKSDIPVESTWKLRKKKLDTTLKLLGYSSIEETKSELDDSKSFCALERIGGQLENYINLGTFVHLEGRNKPEDIVRVNVPKGMSREEFINLAIPVTEEYASNLEFIKEQEEKMEQKRGILPDYCEEMSRKIAYNEWLIYSKVIRETAQLLLELNADLITQQSGLSINDFSKLTGTDLEDKISKLIVSKEFATACDIENRFVIREGKRLIKEVDFMLQGAEETIKSSTIMESLKSVKEEENEIISQRNSQNILLRDMDNSKER